MALIDQWVVIGTCLTIFFFFNTPWKGCILYSIHHYVTTNLFPLPDFAHIPKLYWIGSLLFIIYLHVSISSLEAWFQCQLRDREAFPQWCYWIGAPLDFGWTGFGWSGSSSSLDWIRLFWRELLARQWLYQIWKSTGLRHSSLTSDWSNLLHHLFGTVSLYIYIW